MIRTIAVLTLLACNRQATLTGVARDELRLVGLPDVLIVPAKPSDRCPPIHVKPESSGAFSAQVCSGMRYTVSFPTGSGGTTWRGEPVTANAGDTVSLTAWPGAAEPGVYVVGDTVERVSPSIALETSAVLPSNTPVRYPLELPSTVARVLPGHQLLLQGSEADDQFVPLGASTTTLSYARAAGPAPMGPWSFEGANISPDGVVSPLPAVAVAPTSVTVTGVELAYVSADLVPPGRYLVGKPGGARAWLVDFGPAPTP